jgi:hypothetical protein
MTHDYKRHGMTTLFAALDVLEGKIIGRCMQRHWHQESAFSMPSKPRCRSARSSMSSSTTTPRTSIPRSEPGSSAIRASSSTSASWLNAVEGFFAKLTKRRLKRGVFRSIVDLQAAINRFLDETNDNPRPFTWTADPDKIIAAVKRGHQVLDSIH